MIRNLSICLFIVVNIICLNRCTKSSVYINPAIKTIFKPLELATYVLVCDSLSDTLSYHTQGMKIEFSKSPYTQYEFESVHILGTEKEGNPYMELLSIEFYEQDVDSDELIVNFDLSVGGVHFYLNNLDFNLSQLFNNSYTLNGVEFDNCLVITNYNQNGLAYTSLVYSPINGILLACFRINGPVYLRCFDCE